MALKPHQPSIQSALRQQWKLTWHCSNDCHHHYHRRKYEQHKKKTIITIITTTKVYHMRGSAVVLNILTEARLQKKWWLVFLIIYFPPLTKKNSATNGPGWLLLIRKQNGVSFSFSKNVNVANHTTQCHVVTESQRSQSFLSSICCDFNTWKKGTVWVLSCYFSQTTL